MGKGHSNVSPEADHCLRDPRPQTSRLQTPRVATTDRYQEHKIKNCAAGPRFKERTSNKCVAGTLYDLGTSCNPGRGHEGRLVSAHTHMLIS